MRLPVNSTNNNHNEEEGKNKKSTAATATSTQEPEESNDNNKNKNKQQAKKRIRMPNFRRLEDIALAKAYRHVCAENVVKQKADALWESIKTCFDSTLVLITKGENLSIAVERDAESLRSRFKKIIRKAVDSFNVIYKSVVDKNGENTDSDVLLQDAKYEYNVQTGHYFAFTECWEILKTMPEFDPMLLKNVQHQQTNDSRDDDEDAAAAAGVDQEEAERGPAVETTRTTTAKKKKNKKAKLTANNICLEAARVLDAAAGNAATTTTATTVASSSKEEEKSQKMLGHALTSMNQTISRIATVMEHDAIVSRFQNDIDTEMQFFQAIVSSGGNNNNNENASACRQEIKRLQAERNLLLSRLENDHDDDDDD